MKSVILAALLSVPVAASAATYQLDATSTEPGTYSDFSLIFDDLDGDSLFSGDELLSFTGVSISNRIGTSLFDEIAEVPDLPGLTDGLNEAGDPGELWGFRHSDTLVFGVDPAVWTYQITPMALVPIPATALLLLGALGGLGVVRRRRGA